MVLFHKHKIVDALVSRLVPDAPLSLEPLLSLTANLAKDLRHELFEFLPEIITALMPLLRVRDSDVIEVRIPLQILTACPHLTGKS
ncbi:hypothetical protein AMAG_18614 [Allomyces macrogynus ATCC 38327]|uniref:Uncharacterized protein n=1 Tax=Allomyces macrogynus (strain ATCC 38327) TaxID=578462 RepID=A0A0L0SFP4_ALLM3|nr:hypothetical protein AMAG_18614 [Allomyces macrogynus ATCC 38327]|eukprot:KNE61338.1 hypothetical protein AMAG_18614 [Allomyces macrogynus ATCC 38327]